MSNKEESLLIDFNNSNSKKDPKENPKKVKTKTNSIKLKKGFLIGTSVFSALALATSISFFTISTININNTVNKKYTVEKREEHCQILITNSDKKTVSDYKANTELSIEIFGITEGYYVSHINILNSNNTFLYSVPLDGSNKAKITTPNFNIVVSAVAYLPTIEHNLYYYNTTPGIFSLVFKNSKNETITSSPEGEKVIIDFNILSGYTLDSVFINGKSLSPSSVSGKYEFIMPGSDVVVDIQTTKQPQSTFSVTFRITSDQAKSGVLINDDIIPISKEFKDTIIYKNIENKPSASQTNYKFIGWSTNSTDVSSLISLDHSITTPETYYPYLILESSVLNITMDLGEFGEITPTNLQVAPNQKVETLSIPTPAIKEEYKTTKQFKCWSWTDSSSPTPIKQSDTFNSIDHKQLYAIYQDK